VAFYIHQVDAFTCSPFRGNPAGVCILTSAMSERWMQAIAREMNQSETAFLSQRKDGSYDLRWFTPSIEVDLCGHATLASAHVLWTRQLLGAKDVARFHTRSGLLTASRVDDAIELDFPITPAHSQDPPLNLLPALGINSAVAVGRTKFDFLVEVASESIVRDLSPNMPALKSIDCRGVIVTARSQSDECDFVSRFFAPRAGIDEDPVTGSAHCALGQWWIKRFGKTELRARQLSQRGGELRVRLVNDRAILIGQAVHVWTVAVPSHIEQIAEADLP
jgi:PhzF family phenazine biosynthesis protein